MLSRQMSGRSSKGSSRYTDRVRSVRRAMVSVAFLMTTSVAGSCAPRPVMPPRPVVTRPRQPVAPPASVTAPVIAETPDAPFRAQPPPPRPTPPFRPPQVESFRLANGMQVLLVERHDLPIVVVQFVTRRGGDDLPVNRAGLASLVGVLLDQGTTTRNALELSDAFQTLGAAHGTWVDWDSGGAYVKVLSSNLAPALELLADVIQRPAFSSEEIERARGRRLAAIRQQIDQPAAIAGIVAARVVYGDEHPYGRTLLGTEASVRAITREDIVRFHRSHFVPSEGALVVVGDVTRNTLAPWIERTFGTWRGRASRSRALPAVPPVGTGPRIFLVDRPGAAQSQVVLTHAGVPRSSPDYVPLVVMNTILGGMFSSRINLNLRERHAYTYGARSSFSFRHGPGPFTIGGAISTANTAAAVREILAELSRMRDSDVTEDELNAARTRLTESLPARFETNEQTASAIAELFVYGLPLDEYATFAARVNAVTAADIRRVAERYLRPDQVRIVVVGDRSAVEPGLNELGLGPVEIRDEFGDRPNARSPSGS